MRVRLSHPPWPRVEEKPEKTLSETAGRDGGPTRQTAPSPGLGALCVIVHRLCRRQPLRQGRQTAQVQYCEPPPGIDHLCSDVHTAESTHEEIGGFSAKAVALHGVWISGLKLDLPGGI
jgi:hypothetical protein